MQRLPAHLGRAFQRWGLVPSPRRTAALALSRNLIVVCTRGARLYLVKAALTREDASDLDFEGQLLPRLSAHLARVPGAPLVPTVHAARRGMLALEWIPGGTLFRHWQRGGADPGERVGAALGVLHDSTAAGEPWLSARRPVGDMVEQLVWSTAPRDAALELWRRVQADPKAARALERLLADEAAGHEVLVHGDLRHANVILNRGRVAFVDWELAGRGDFARDLGMLLAEDVAGWLGGGLSQAAMRRRLGSVRRGHRRTAPGLLDGAQPRVIGWLAEALLRRAYTLAHQRGFGAEEARLADTALELLRAPKAWAPKLLGR